MILEIVIAECVVTTVTEKLMKMAFSYMEDRKTLQSGMKDELERLKESLPNVCAVLGAIEKGQIEDPNPELQGWMWQLRDVIEEAEDVLDEIEYNRLEEDLNGGKNKLCDVVACVMEVMLPVCNCNPTPKRLRECVKRLDEIAANLGAFMAWSLANTTRHWQQDIDLKASCAAGSATSTDADAVFGRDEERDWILKLLTELKSGTASSYYNFSIILIAGIAGVGKTTLARYVYDDPRVKYHFNLHIWVVVSEVFDATTLIKTILYGATGTKPMVDDLAILYDLLIKELKSKRFLLVLDDVSNDIDNFSWRTLTRALSYGEKGSKVLMTSRLEKVKNIIKAYVQTCHLNGLAENSFWLLFTKCAFGNSIPLDHSKLKDIGIAIAKRLNGLPLAARTIGGLLRDNLDEEHWANILESIKSCCGKGDDDVMSILKLSFDQLPGDLKNCFRLCTIFPHDYKFKKDELVCLWIGAGVVQQHGMETPEKVALYFDELVSRSFLAIQKDGHADAIEYTTNSLLGYLASSFSTGEYLRIAADGAVEIPKTLRHLAVETKSLDQIKKISELKYLRTLLINYKSGYDDEVQLEFRKLKSKNLRVFHFLVHPHGIPISLKFLRDLRHLRCLDLTGNQINTLPKVLGRLYHLKVLKVGGVSVPAIAGMKNLINLRHLISDPGSQIYRICGVGKLTSLQELCFDVRNRIGYKVEQLQHMNELRELYMTGLENIESAEESSRAKLKDKGYLGKLELRWSQHASSTDLVLAEQVLHHLEPPCSLIHLAIDGYKGVKSPGWLENLYLPKLESIQLRNCSNWKTLPSLGHLAYLRIIHLHFMDAGEGFAHGFHDHGDGIVFPQLLGGGVLPYRLFPHLQVLQIDHCPKLMQLPQQLCLSTSLQDLSIRNCYELEHDAVGVEGFGGLRNLKSLLLEECPKLVGSGLLLPSALKSLTISKCRLHDESLSMCLGGLASLSSLKIGGGYKDDGIDDHDKLEQLTSLPSVEVLQCLTSLWLLEIKGFGKLKDLEGLHALPSLQTLKLRGLPGVLSLSPLPSSLKYLNLNRLRKLKSLPALPVSLQRVKIRFCPLELMEQSTEEIGSDIESIQRMVSGLEGKIGLLENKKDLTNAGVYYLCQVAGGIKDGISAKIFNGLRFLADTLAEAWGGKRIKERYYTGERSPRETNEKCFTESESSDTPIISKLSGISLTKDGLIL